MLRCANLMLFLNDLIRRLKDLDYTGGLYYNRSAYYVFPIEIYSKIVATVLSILYCNCSHGAYHFNTELIKQEGLEYDGNEADFTASHLYAEVCV